MKFNLVYINLAHATERRAFVEKNFSECGFSSDWTIRRLEARPVDDQLMEKLRSQIRKGQTGCYLSHLECMHQSFHDDRHLVIAEDDVIFSPNTEAQIRRAIAHLGDDWDMLFTDVCMPNAQDMIRFFPIRASLMQSNGLHLQDLRNFGFAGSTCYVINARSKKNIFNALMQNQPFSIPYDLHLRGLIGRGMIKAFVTFPFTTSLSEHANVSQIQTTSEVMTNMLWNSFRQLVWIDADADRVLQSFDGLSPALFDRRATAFSKIMQGMVAENYYNL